MGWMMKEEPECLGFWVFSASEGSFMVPFHEDVQGLRFRGSCMGPEYGPLPP